MWGTGIRQIIDSQFEESIGDLQHQDVRMVVLVADEDAFARPSHAMLLVVFLQTFQTGKHRRVFFRLRLLGAESVVAEREQADRFWLIVGEGFG